LWSFSTSSACVIRPTISGWLIVCAAPIGSAVFSQARSLKKSGTNASRGTRSIAASTSRSVTPPWRSSMTRRARRVSDFMEAARRTSAALWHDWAREKSAVRFSPARS